MPSYPVFITFRSMPAMSKELKPLHLLLCPDAIHVGLAAPDKPAAIQAMVDLLAGHAAILDLDAVKAAVLKRESVMSTGVGKGLALPHAKTDAVSEMMMALAISEEGIPFDSIDGTPVRILVLLVAPMDAALQHVRLLGQITRMMTRESFRNRLLQASDPNAVIRYFEEEETRMREGN